MGLLLYMTQPLSLATLIFFLFYTFSVLIILCHGNFFSGPVQSMVSRMNQKLLRVQTPPFCIIVLQPALLFLSDIILSPFFCLDPLFSSFVFYYLLQLLQFFFFLKINCILNLKDGNLIKFSSPESSLSLSFLITYSVLFLNSGIIP